MTTEQVEEKVRETLRAVALDRVRAPGDLAETVVRRRSRRRYSQAAGAAVAVAAITVGAVFGFGGGGTAEHDRPARPHGVTGRLETVEEQRPGRRRAGLRGGGFRAVLQRVQV